MTTADNSPVFTLDDPELLAKVRKSPAMQDPAVAELVQRFEDDLADRDADAHDFESGEGDVDELAGLPTVDCDLDVGCEDPACELCATAVRQ